MGRRSHSSGIGRVSRAAVLAGLAAAAAPGTASLAAGEAQAAAAGGTHAIPAIVGALTHHTARHEDTLLDLARHYNVGYTELRAANAHIDPWLPGAGTEIIVPASHLLPEGVRKGLVVNLGDQRLYYFPPGGGEVLTAPIGIGGEGWRTPIGRTSVVRKRERPIWYVPASIRAEDPELPAVVPPGPDNPLGRFALYLGWPAYVIHGTNKPYGVGRRVSHGCVRLYPEDIARLFEQVAIGTPVTVLDEPIKLAWVGDWLMIEAHPSQAQADEVEATGRPTPETPVNIRERILEKAGPLAGLLDWRRINTAIRERSGMPLAILKRDAAAG